MRKVIEKASYNKVTTTKMKGWLYESKKCKFKNCVPKLSKLPLKYSVIFIAKPLNILHTNQNVPANEHKAQVCKGLSINGLLEMERETLNLSNHW